MEIKRWQGILAWWVDIAGRAALWVVLLALLATGVILHYTINHLGIYTDTAKMLSEDLPFRQIYEDYKQTFPQYVDTLLVVIEGETPGLAEDARNALADRLEQETGLFKTVYLPGGGPFFRQQGLLYLSISELQDLTDNLAQVQPFLGKLTREQDLVGLFSLLNTAIEAIQEGEELDLSLAFEQIEEGLIATLAGRFYRLSWQALMRGGESSVADRRRFIVVQPYLDYSQWLPAGPAMQAVRRLAEELQINPAHGVRVRITGQVALAHEELQTVTRGAELAGILALVTVGIVLFVGLGAWQMVFATLATLLAGLIFTAGFATFAVGNLNLISIAFAVLYIGLGVDYAVHFCLRYRELLQQGHSHRPSLRDAGQSVGGSLVLCAFTTAIGFYAFVPTAFAGVSELGLISGTGMFISLFATLTLLPALLSLLPGIRVAHPPAEITGRPARALLYLPQRHARIILWGTGLLGLAALLVLPQARFDFNPIHLRSPETESVATFYDLLEHSTTSPWSIVVLAENAATAEKKAAQLEQLEAVDQVLTIESFIPKHQDQKLAIIEDIALIMGPQLRMIQDTPAPGVSQQMATMQDLLTTLQNFIQAHEKDSLRRSAQNLHANLTRFLETLAVRSFEEQQDLLARLEQALLGTLPGRLEDLRTSLNATPVSRESLPEDLVERWVAADGRHRIEVFPEERLDKNVELRRFVSAVQAVAPKATDAAVLNLESGQAVVKAFIEAFSYALIAISILLLTLLSPKRDTLLVIIPLLLMALFTGASTVWLDIPFNFANVIALPLLLGIGVDSGIHMVHRFRTALPPHGNLLATSTARAVLFSALTTICSFGNLAVSPHPGTASMGMLLTLGLGFTLICTMIILPALLQQWAGSDRS